VRQEPYTFATSAYWVPLSKLIKNVTRATATAEIEIFEGNMAELRADEIEELSRECLYAISATTICTSRMTATTCGIRTLCTSSAPRAARRSSCGSCQTRPPLTSLS